MSNKQLSELQLKARESIVAKLVASPNLAEELYKIKVSAIAGLQMATIVAQSVGLDVDSVAALDEAFTIFIEVVKRKEANSKEKSFSS